jgi:hypothetical protein
MFIKETKPIGLKEQLTLADLLFKMSLYCRYRRCPYFRDVVTEVREAEELA